jgi:hypothetical protein
MAKLKRHQIVNGHKSMKKKTHHRIIIFQNKFFQYCKTSRFVIFMDAAK